MIPKQRIWFERPFDLNLPVEGHPEALSRLRGAPPRLEELIDSISPSAWTRPVEGGWSIQTHVGHLIDLEVLWAARVGDFLSGSEVVAAADLENRATEEADHHQRPMDDLLSEFRRLRKALCSDIEALDAEALARVSLHPRLRVPITPTGLCFFVAEHDDHHMAAIYGLGRGRAQT